MKLSFEERILKLRHPFILSGSQYSEKKVIQTKLEWRGQIGIGESSPSQYFGEPPESVCECLVSMQSLLEKETELSIQSLHDIMAHHFPKNFSARSAVVMAAYDAFGKSCALPVYQLLGLDHKKIPRSSFTIGMDDKEKIKVKLAEANKFPILKVKLGFGDRDFELITFIRESTDKKIRVDVNEGWNKEEAARKIEWLAKQNIEFVEQPLPKEDWKDMAWLKARTPLPLVADENVLVASDIPKLKDGFHGVNIKLDKCGGLWEAQAMIHTARALEMKVMLGCMISSSIGISAMAQLAPKSDACDLDGSLLISNNNFPEVVSGDGKIKLSDKPGLGL